MYKRRIKEWGLDKSLKKDEVLAMLRKKVHRGKAGKTSNFLLRGRVVEWQNVERYLKRHRFNSESLTELLDAPDTPEALRCYTPPPELSRGIPVPCPRSAFEMAIFSLNLMASRLPKSPLYMPSSSVASSFHYLHLKWSMHKSLEHLTKGIQSWAESDWSLYTARMSRSFHLLGDLVESESPGSIIALVRAFHLLKQTRLTAAAGSMLHTVCKLSASSDQDPRAMLCLTLYNLTAEELKEL